MSEHGLQDPVIDERGRPRPALRRITRALTQTEEYPLAQASRLCSRFRLASPVEVHDFPEKGNINQLTFLVFAGTPRPAEYLLQRINERVFTRPRSVMRAMIASIDAQRASMAAGQLAPGDEWETIELVGTREDRPYLDVENCRGPGCWRLMVKIPEARTYKSLGEIADPAERLRVAEEAGRGLAIYGNLTCRMRTENLENPLPGYRDTAVYLRPVPIRARRVTGRRRTRPTSSRPMRPSDTAPGSTSWSTSRSGSIGGGWTTRGFAPWIDLVRSEESFGMTLLEGMKSGRIRRLAIHGDTKLDNFLFSTRTGRAKALVDLDTIMPHSWLADWGDMVRSLVNVAGEKERDLSRVRVDMDVFRAVARGFLSTAREVTPAEVDLMVDAPQILALELGLRFLADYLRGDSYFKLGPADPPDLNRVRALAQLTLFRTLRERADEAGRFIGDLRAEFDGGRDARPAGAGKKGRCPAAGNGEA